MSLGELKEGKSVVLVEGVGVTKKVRVGEVRVAAEKGKGKGKDVGGGKEVKGKFL